jgi:serine O-acetyltransferase
MTRSELMAKVPEISRSLAAQVVGGGGDPSRLGLERLGDVLLPNQAEIIRGVKLLREVIFPGYFGDGLITADHVGEVLGTKLRSLAELLYEQVRCCLRYRQNLGEGSSTDECSDCDAEAATTVAAFLGQLGEVRVLLAGDVKAAFEADPAARGTDETIYSYPGLYAIFVHRCASRLARLGVPLMPRIMTEHAHSLTGIDIHPGATLGPGFFIDHGTGVVIGETCEIGSNVRIYQGVTLGALAPDRLVEQFRGRKRHPSIEDDVTIYAGATILGGDTRIGRGSVIGGNVFITSSVPPMTTVTAEPPRLQYRERRRGKAGPADFQI